MCLDVTKNTRIRTVKKERTVYKIMVIRASDKKRLYSPFQLFPVDMGETYDIKKNLFIDDCFVVDEGFHSYKDFEDTKDDLIIDSKGYAEANDIINFVIVECKIPVGAKIVKGSFAGMVSYVSDKITYVKTIFELYENDN